MTHFLEVSRNRVKPRYQDKHTAVDHQTDRVAQPPVVDQMIHPGRVAPPPSGSQSFVKTEHQLLPWLSPLLLVTVKLRQQPPSRDRAQPKLYDYASLPG